MLSDAEEKFIKQWEAKKPNGKLHHVLLVGVLGWGVPMFVIMTFIIGSGSFSSRTSSSIIINSGIYLIGGVVFGYTTWYYGDRKYNKLIAKGKDKMA